MYDHSTLDHERGVFARWDVGKAHLFMREPGGWCYGYFQKGSKMPVLASFRKPTREDGERTECWGGVVPGTSFQLGHIRWESGLVHLAFRRVRWPSVDGRSDWEPTAVRTVANGICARIRAWWADMRGQPVIRRGEPSF
jgi:hypothetical protein